MSKNTSKFRIEYKFVKPTKAYKIYLLLDLCGDIFDFLSIVIMFHSSIMKQSVGQQQVVTSPQYKFNIMIDQTIPKSFDPIIWKFICSTSPQEYLNTQENIMQILVSDKRLFESFFKRFYLNHTQLHNWQVLAKENQLQIKRYVFRQLLDKSYKQYREAIKDEEVKQNYNQTNEVFRIDQKTKNKKKQSFHKVLLGNYKLGKPAPNLPRQVQAQLKNGQHIKNVQFEKEDYHQLFLKTFNACDGNKYIYYDFDKHMKGMEEQKKYNNFIRVKKHTRMHNSMAMKDDQVWLNKENSCSTHSNIQSYFHQGEESLEKMKYCQYNLNPVGQIKNSVLAKEQYILKKLPNIFRRLNKTHQNYKSFILKKKKIF